MYNVIEPFYEELQPINNFSIEVVFNEKIKIPINGGMYKPSYDSLMVKDTVFKASSIVRKYKYKNHDTMQIGALVELINNILIKLSLYNNDLLTKSLTKQAKLLADFLNTHKYLNIITSTSNIIYINKLIYYNDIANKQYLFVSYPYKKVNSINDQLKEIISLRNYEKDNGEFNLNSIELYDWIKNLFKYPRKEELYYTFYWNNYNIMFRHVNDFYG